MKRFKYAFLLPASIILIAVACSKTTTTTTTTIGNWISKGKFSFDGSARTGAVSFVIGDTAYIGTGYDGTYRLNDFWALNPVTLTWEQRAIFGGSKRNTAVGFSIGNKGYIATGFDGTNRLSDNWEYDQASNSWTQKANLPDPANSPVGSGARYSAVGFSIGNYGYICSGFAGGYTKDLWRFDPSTGALGAWIQQPSMGGAKRSGATAMVYKNKAYIVTGINNGQAVTDMWVYDPSNTTTPWSALRDIYNSSTDTYDDLYTDIARSNAASFVSGDYGYITTGENGSYVKSTWEYSFALDTWTLKTSYEGQERSGAVAYTVKGKSFVGLGRNSTYYFDNLDQFLPFELSNAND